MWAQPFQVLGPTECINCHDHETEKTWWQKEDGPLPLGHINALNQMENLKTSDFAKAVGLADPYDSNGDCVRCHATVYKGEAYNGVSCESCHGPGSGYLEVHQEEDSRARSTALGLNPVFGDVNAWVDACLGCHLMDDARLIAAGHPSGAEFVLEEKFAIVGQHWETDYDRGAVAAASRLAVERVLARRQETAAAVEAAAAEQAAAATAAAERAAEEAAAAERVADAAAAAERAAAVAAAAERAVVEAEAARMAAEETAAVERAIAERAVAARAAAAREAAERAAAARAVARASAPSNGLPTGSSAVRAPAPVVDEAGSPLPGLDIAPLLPLTSSELVAAVQGRLITLLDSLLRRGGRTPVRVTPPESETDYESGDAELLALQEAALKLALEALGTAPGQAPVQADEAPESPPEEPR